MKFKMLVLTILTATAINTMEEPPESVTTLEHLPKEIHAQIILNLVAGNTAQDAINNILNFTKVNKTFAPFLNDEYTNKLLIQKLAGKYFNNNVIKAAQELNTAGARLWLASYLAQGKQQKQEAVSPLFAALNAKDNKSVINLINAGLDVDTRDKKLSKTPLMVAAHNGDLVLMDFLISKGAAIDSSDKHGLTPLFYAIRNGKIEAVKLLLDKGALIEATNNVGSNSLKWAIHKKQPAIAKLLIDKNADIASSDKKGTTALMEAAQHNLPEIAQLLISKGADVNAVGKDGFSALIDAAFEKSPEIVALLLQAGANPLQITQQGFTTLFAGAEDPETLKLLLNTPARTLINNQNNLGFTALMSAAIAGNLESVKLLLQAGADPNIKDAVQSTALSYAFSAHSFEAAPIIKALLEAGADPNLESGFDSILLSAIRALYENPQEDNIEPALAIIKDLLAHNANPNFQSSAGNATPLILAAWTPLPINTIIETLIQAGANINEPILNGTTPLMASVPSNDLSIPAQGHIENLRTFLNHSDQLNLDAQDTVGYTALTTAISLNNREAVQELLEAGANPTLATQIGTPLQLAVGKNEIIDLLNKYIRQAETLKEK